MSSLATDNTQICSSNIYLKKKLLFVILRACNGLMENLFLWSVCAAQKLDQVETFLSSLGLLMGCKQELDIYELNEKE